MSAFSTNPFAKSVHGKDPQGLIEKIARDRIRESRYFAEKCFGVDASSIIENAAAVTAIGGMFSEMNKPTDFICLVLKLLQIQPSFDVIIAYIKNEDFKYLRALGVFYLRLVGSAQNVYKHLEPLLNDYRKLRYRARNEWKLTTMDAFVEELLRESIVLGIALPRLVKRLLLEEQEVLQPRKSPLEEYYPEQFEQLLSDVGKKQKRGASNISMADANSEASVQKTNESTKEKDPKKNKKKSDSQAKKHRRERRSRSRSIDRFRRSNRSRSKDRFRRSNRSRSKDRFRRSNRSRSRGDARKRSRRDHRDRSSSNNSISGRRVDDEYIGKRKERKHKSKKKSEEEMVTNMFGLKGSTSKKSRDVIDHHNADGAAVTTSSSGGNKDNLTVDQWNDVRAKLGLKPLKNK